MTGPTQTPPCPECAPGAAEPHTEPGQLHVHLTPYGYLLYTPGHERPSFIEEMREAAYRAGREDAIAGPDVTSPDHDSVYLDVRDGQLTVTQTTGGTLTVAVNGGFVAVPDRVRATIELTGWSAGEPDRGEGEWDAHDRAEHNAQLQAHRDEYGPELEAERAGDQP